MNKKNTEIVENPQTGEKFVACPTCRGEGHVPLDTHAVEVLSDYFELNMSSYTRDDVERLSTWAYFAFRELSRLNNLVDEGQSILGMTENPSSVIDPALLAGLHKTGAAGGYIDFTVVHPTGVQDQLSEHQGTVFESYEFSDGIARIMTRQEFDKEYGNALRIQLERARENRRLNRIDDSYRTTEN